MPYTTVEMVQYPTGRVRSFLSLTDNDWRSFELYRILRDVEEGLGEVEEDASVEPGFSYLEKGRPDVESLEGLLEAGRYSPVTGSATVEAGPVEGEIDYTTAVPRETDAALEAEFTVPEPYEQQLREILADAGFKDPVIPRITRRAIES